jgi:hypothetical protein
LFCSLYKIIKNNKLYIMNTKYEIQELDIK